MVDFIKGLCSFVNNLYSFTNVDKGILDKIFNILPSGNFYMEGFPVGRYMYLIGGLIIIWQLIELLPNSKFVKGLKR